MKIISAYENTPNGNIDIDIKTISDKDKKEIERKHNKAMKAEITWAFFGGVISIDNRNFQVMP